ncbi:hypothetical protein [Paenibacillus piri]|uniref:Nucleotidyltransferase family protein n=1 Tax=Paenibacillus piri TaxID=2547395 RepID=A0A4R5KDC3_9BACL|nr:hypothetical protein [Paenibacillus piri]TDF92177.1 hypothetical protein E1757_30765 [Paenibacillus piri]
MTLKLELESVRLLARRLDEAGIGYASGGSGLLYSLGLSEQVHDWDVTTDAPYEQVAAVLCGLPWAASPCGDYPFASSYRLTIADERLPIDVIGQFAIHSGTGICRLPAFVSTDWLGIRMGSPEVWAAAYTLMGRETKAELLLSYLERSGADRDAVQRLLSEPLPEPLRSRLLRLV